MLAQYNSASLNISHREDCRREFPSLFACISPFFGWLEPSGPTPSCLRKPWRFPSASVSKHASVPDQSRHHAIDLLDLVILLSVFEMLDCDCVRPLQTPLLSRIWLFDREAVMKPVFSKAQGTSKMLPSATRPNPQRPQRGVCDAFSQGLGLSSRDLQTQSRQEWSAVCNQEKAPSTTSP